MAKHRQRLVIEFEIDEGADTNAFKRMIAKMQGIKFPGLQAKTLTIRPFEEALQVAQIQWAADLALLNPDHLQEDPNLGRLGPLTHEAKQRTTLDFRNYLLSRELEGGKQSVVFHGFEIDLTGIVHPKDIGKVAARVRESLGERMRQILSNNRDGRGAIIDLKRR
jgi:hypothetical protein